MDGSNSSNKYLLSHADPVLYSSAVTHIKGFEYFCFLYYLHMSVQKKRCNMCGNWQKGSQMESNDGFLFIFYFENEMKCHKSSLPTG